MAIKEQKFTKTPFKKQAEIISSILRQNPMINDSDKESLNETVGVLTWMNQLQLHWSSGGKGIPDQLYGQIFEGRAAQTIAPTAAA